MENEPSAESRAEDLGGEIADVIRPLGEEYGFDEQTCQEIAAMPFPDAFETAYSYLSSAGLNPEEVLARFMQEPEAE